MRDGRYNKPRLAQHLLAWNQRHCVLASHAQTAHLRNFLALYRKHNAVGPIDIHRTRCNVVLLHASRLVILGDTVGGQAPQTDTGPSLNRADSSLQGQPFDTAVLAGKYDKYMKF